jgi:hypothetical protein
MSGQIQLIFALAIVAVAALALAFRTWRWMHGPSRGCSSGCGRCARREEPAEKRLVNLDTSPASHGARNSHL